MKPPAYHILTAIMNGIRKYLSAPSEGLLEDLENAAGFLLTDARSGEAFKTSIFTVIERPDEYGFDADTLRDFADMLIEAANNLDSPHETTTPATPDVAPLVDRGE